MVIFVTLDHVLGKSCVLQLSAGPRVCSLTQTPGGGSRRASGVRRWCVLWGGKAAEDGGVLVGAGPAITNQVAQEGLTVQPLGLCVPLALSPSRPLGLRGQSLPAAHAD